MFIIGRRSWIGMWIYNLGLQGRAACPASVILILELRPIRIRASPVNSSNSCFPGPVLLLRLLNIVPRPQTDQKLVDLHLFLLRGPTKVFDQNGFLTVDLTDKIKGGLRVRNYLAENGSNWSMSTYCNGALIKKQRTVVRIRLKNAWTIGSSCLSQCLQWQTYFGSQFSLME